MALEVKRTLTTKYGPLPGWAWIGILAGGTYLYLRYRQASADQAASDGTDTGAGSDVGGGPGGTFGGGTHTGAGSGVQNVYYGIKRCPKGFHKVGHHCVRDSHRQGGGKPRNGGGDHKRPRDGGGGRRHPTRTPAHDAFAGPVARKPIYAPRGFSIT